MSANVFFEFATGYTLNLDVQQISSGLFYDFANGVFSATPATQLASLPEGSGTALGQYSYQFASTPPATWSNGSYLVRVHDQNRANQVIGLAELVMANGSDQPYYGAGGSGTDPLTEAVPGSFAAGTAGAVLGAIPGELSSISAQIAALTPATGPAPTAINLVTPPSQVLSQPLGTDRTYQITLYDSGGNLVTSFEAADALSAAIWAGDDMTTSVAPSVTWITPAQGTISLTVSAANTASLSTGLYRIRVAIAPLGTGQLLVAYDGRIEFTYSAAAGTPRPVYCTYQDLLKIAPWIESIQDAANDQAQFTDERADARAWFDECCLRNFHATYMGQYGAASQYLFDFWGAGGPRKSVLASRWLTQALAANQLLVSVRVARVNALYALSQICTAQILTKSSYAALAAKFWHDAQNLLISTVAEIDVDGDGYGEVAIKFSTAVSLHT